MHSKNTIDGSSAIKRLPGFFVFSCFPKDFMSRFLSQCSSLVQYFGSKEIRDRMFSMAALASLNSRNMKKKQDSSKRVPYFLQEAEWILIHTHKQINLYSYHISLSNKLVNKKNTYHHYSYEIQLMKWFKNFHILPILAPKVAFIKFVTKYQKEQEAHGPHCSPEKTVQINRHTWLYHKID